MDRNHHGGDFQSETQNPESGGSRRCFIFDSMWMRRHVLQALSFQYLLVTERSDPLARASWVLLHRTLPIPCCGAPRSYVISNSKPRVREDHQDANWCQLHHRSESRMPAELISLFESVSLPCWPSREVTIRGKTREFTIWSPPADSSSVQLTRIAETK